MRIPRFFLIIATVAVLYMPLSGQQVEHMPLEVESQYELPKMTEQYSPVGNWFDWTFGFTVFSDNDATISIQVVQSDLFREIRSRSFGPGQYTITDRNFTGNGMDRLKIGIGVGSYPEVFSDMKFDVYYFCDQEK